MYKFAPSASHLLSAHRAVDLDLQPGLYARLVEVVHFVAWQLYNLVVRGLLQHADSALMIALQLTLRVLHPLLALRHLPAHLMPIYCLEEDVDHLYQN